MQGRDISTWFISLEANLTPIKTQKEYLSYIKKFALPAQGINHHGGSISSVSQGKKEVQKSHGADR